jgi:hypothetical protein
VEEGEQEQEKLRRLHRTRFPHSPIHVIHATPTFLAFLMASSIQNFPATYTVTAIIHSTGYVKRLCTISQCKDYSSHMTSKSNE